MFLSIEDGLKSALQQHLPILERLENSIDFSRQIGGKATNQFNGALVRAAVTELVSIEDVQKQLYKSGLLTKKSLYMNDPSIPLLSVVRELRNVNIHISGSTVSSDKRDLLWGNKDKPDEAIPMNHDIYWIDNLDIQSFTSLDKFGKKYDQIEFHEALQWFDAMQRDWGITELLYRTAMQYADQIVKTHS